MAGKPENKSGTSTPDSFFDASLDNGDRETAELDSQSKVDNELAFLCNQLSEIHLQGPGNAKRKKKLRGSKTRRKPTFTGSLPSAEEGGTMNGGEGTNESSAEPATLATAFEEQVRPFIDLIDDLRCHGLDKDISLPSVVVIGDQSSGKSSILEAISGVQLPRGSGIVTRCPLEMQLKKTRSNNPWRAKLSYRPKLGVHRNIDVTDRNTLSHLIEGAQNEIAGDNKGISSTLITLRVESPSSPDLTLIDLPGIARTPVGDQPLDISDQIKCLLTETIRKRNTIILCVLPCNVDIATNEALSMAKAVDPDGTRTLGVLTKPDLIDEGSESEIIAILNNQKFVLKKGYLIVRCRGQRDLSNKLDLATALVQESQFFERHPVFREVPEDMRGTRQLSQRLTTILVEHIQDTLPDIRNEVRIKLEEARGKMALLGEAPPGDEGEKRLFLLKLVDEALKRIKGLLIDGDTISSNTINLRKRGLAPGTYNSSLLWRQQSHELKEKIDKSTEEAFTRGFLSSSNIASKMMNSRGPELPGFISYQLFEKIVREHISSYKHFSKNFLDLMSADVEDLVAFVFNECFSRLPQVKGKCKGIAEEVRENCKDEAWRLLELEMKRERLVFSQDTTFEKEMDIIAQEKEEEMAAQIRATPRGQQPPTTTVASGFPFGGIAPAPKSVFTAASIPVKPKRDSSEVMQALLSTYLNIANRRFLDNVPLLFRMKLHCDFFEDLQRKLQKLCSGSDVNVIVEEEKRAKLDRQQLKARIERLSYATAELSYKL